MKAVRIHQFGGIDALAYEEVSLPEPGEGQVLVRVKAAGVGPWDALIREHKSAVHSPLPLILGSDLAGVVAAAGENVTSFKTGDEVYGVTNPEFVGAYAEYALAWAKSIAGKPQSLDFNHAASVPVIAVTAWQM